MKAKQKIESFKEQMNLNADQMQQWAVARQQKEEDVLALQKYFPFIYLFFQVFQGRRDRHKRIELTSRETSERATHGWHTIGGGSN